MAKGAKPMLKHSEMTRRVSRDKAFEEVVSLILNQDRVAHSWIARYITIQAGLAAAEFALMGFIRAGTTTSDNALAHAALIVVPVLGIVFALAAMGIIRREFYWSRLYIVTARHVENGDRRIIFNFINDFKSSATDDERRTVNQLGRIEWYLMGVTFFVILSWIFMLVTNLSR